MPDWTLLSLLNWTTEYFQKHQIDSARLDAEILLAHYLKLERIQLYMKFDQPLSPEELAGFKILIKRRAQQEPVAYITGEKEFWGLSFKVNSSVLIPRPDTEILIEKVIEAYPDKNHHLKILEVGTGSGNIVIALAKHFPNSKIQTHDVSEAALKVAQENASTHNVQDQIDFQHSNFLEKEFSQDSKFDLLVSNPPYVRKKEIEGLENNVKDFEPHLALDGGEDGLVFYRKLAGLASQILNSQGRFMVEIGEDQGEEVQNLMDQAGLTEVQVYQDYAGLDRVVSAKFS